MEQTTLEMNLKTLMSNYAHYNLWANETIVAWLKSKPSEKLQKYAPSSFPSIMQTLLHLWDTERFWLAVLQEIPAPASFKNGFHGTLEDVLEGLIHTSDQLALYAEGLSASHIQDECYLDTPWVKGYRPKFEFIQHVMNHSTYHRGQLITIGHQVGITDAPMTDYNFYNFMVVPKEKAKC